MDKKEKKLLQLKDKILQLLRKQATFLDVIIDLKETADAFEEEISKLEMEAKALEKEIDVETAGHPFDLDPHAPDNAGFDIFDQLGDSPKDHE